MKTLVAGVISFLIAHRFDRSPLQMVVSGGGLACLKTLIVKEVPN